MGNRQIAWHKKIRGYGQKNWTEYTQKGDQGMYSEEQYRKALEVYEKT